MTRTRRIPEGNPRVAVAYLRVSTDDQRLGVDAQRDAVERWAASSGATVALWCVDRGVSGATEPLDRPGLSEGILALREHGAGVIVVARRDRIARDVIVAATVERLAASSGARVVAADGGGNGSSPQDALLRTIVDAMAAYERALIRQRTAAALRVKASRGEYTGGRPPYGWRQSQGRLVAVVAEQTARARARELRAAGLPLRAVSEELARAGHVSREGTPFAPLAVARMCR